MTTGTIGLGLCIAFLALVGPFPPVVPAEGVGVRPEWSISVRPLGGALAPERAALFWVGATNESAAARSLCIRASVVGLTTANGKSVVVSPVVTSAHSCRTEREFGLVLAGQTHFYLVSITPPAGSIGSAELQFRTSIRWSSPENPLGPNQASDLETSQTVLIGDALPR
jgi:hypothetical protein